LKTGAIILAAGGASRFGAPKQLLEWQGVTLLDRACHAALEAGCHPVLRVLGGHAAEILARTCPDGVDTLVHPQWEDGMGSSLAAGAAHMAEMAPDLAAIFILLPDQPLVTPRLLGRLADRLDDSISIVLCDHGRATGPPALFHRRHFAALASLQGDQGAKAIAAKHPSALATLAFPEGALDIDTPEAWEHFTRSATTSPPSGFR
jgi:molybdenum cofactor cytidylyltransferase